MDKSNDSIPLAMKKGSQDIITKTQLDAAKKLMKGPKLSSGFSLVKRAIVALDLVQKCSYQKYDAAIVNQARKNFITNIVTALEIFFKDTVLENKGHWPSDGFEKLLKEKITLLEALNFRKGSKLEAEHLILYALPFTNPDAIQNLFSTLIGRDFWNELDKHRLLEDDDDPSKTLITINDLCRNWKAKLYILYDNRNKIVHEDIANPIRKQYPNEVMELVLSLSQAMPSYFGALFGNQKVKMIYKKFSSHDEKNSTWAVKHKVKE